MKVNFTFYVDHFILSESMIVFIVFRKFKPHLDRTEMHPLQKMTLAFVKDEPSVTEMLHANSLYGYT